MKKLCALLLALMMIVCAAPVWAENEALPDDAVIVTFEGQPVTKGEVVNYAGLLGQNGYTQSIYDYEYALDYVLKCVYVPNAKIKEMGLDVFSPEDEEELLTRAEELLQSYYEEYADHIGASSDADRAEYLRQAKELYEENGVTAEYVAGMLREETAYDRLIDAMELGIGEEEILDFYREEVVAKDREMFEADIPMYEQYTRYGYESSFVPEGFRGVIQILVTFDDADLKAYQAVVQDTASTQEEKDAAREALLATRAETIEDIYARLEAGEDFEKLIAEYGEDPGMQGENLKNGYSVHLDSMMWDSAFVDAAFSEEMTEPGCYSRPSIGKFGAYIVYYLRDVPAGEVAMSDETHTSIKNYLQGPKIYSRFEEWLKDYDVVYDEENLALLLAEGELLAAQED